VRAVLDPNVLVSSVLSAVGAPAQVLARWRSGDFELVASELVIAELERALRYPKVEKLLEPQDAISLVALVREHAHFAADPPAAQRSRDPDDDYLIALAEAERAVVVSGDRHLLELADDVPVLSPRAFLNALEEEIRT